MTIKEVGTELSKMKNDLSLGFGNVLVEKLKAESSHLLNRITELISIDKGTFTIKDRALCIYF